MEKDVQKLINAGQTEDTVIVHAAPGEMVVPPVISNQTQQMINQDMQSVGLNPAEYMVGQGSINNLTGLQEFGFLSKLFKKVKNVAKKVLPVVAPFIPGGPLLKGALTAVAGKASGLDTKDALLGGLTAGLGAKFLGSGTPGKGLEGLKGTSGKFFGKEGTFRNILGRGRDLIFGGGDSLQPYSDAEIDEMLTTMDPSVVGQIVAERNAEISEPRFKGLVGPDSFADKILNIDPNKGTGPLSFLQGSGGQQLFDADGKPVSSGGFGLGGAGGIAGLAALYGLATKKAAEKTEGGLRDIRLSTRPDLMPQQTFQGFDVGVRQGMSNGGGMDRGGALFKPFMYPLGSKGNPVGKYTSEEYPHGVPESNMSETNQILFERRKEIMDILEKSNQLDSTIVNKLNEELKAISMELAGDFNQGMTRNARENNEAMRRTIQKIRGEDVDYGGGINNRPGFALGTGVDMVAMMEQDMRPGGPSVGPGTETSDDIPAMLSDGEFVQTAKANKGLGGFKIEKNKDSITLYPTGKPDREQGFKNNDMMMKMFEDYQEMVS